MQRNRLSPRRETRKPAPPVAERDKSQGEAAFFKWYRPAAVPGNRRGNHKPVQTMRRQRSCAETSTCKRPDTGGRSRGTGRPRGRRGRAGSRRRAEGRLVLLCANQSRTNFSNATAQTSLPLFRLASRRRRWGRLSRCRVWTE